MPIYNYLQFTVDSDDMNQPGSADVTKPSEGWKGSDANDALRATNSALRNLGDRAAKLPTDANGNPIVGPDPGGKIGTAAFQNITTFDMQGGTLGAKVRGSVGGSVLLAVDCTGAQLPQVTNDMRQRGFDLCDGRTTTDPFPPNQRTIIMPDYRGLVLRMSNNNELNDNGVADNVNHARAGGGDRLNANRTVSVDPHTHGNTGTFKLEYANLPSVVTGIGTSNTVPPAQNLTLEAGSARGVVSFATSLGIDQPHAHTTSGALAFQPFTFNVFPPSILIFFFKRVW